MKALLLFTRSIQHRNTQTNPDAQFGEFWTKICYTKKSFLAIKTVHDEAVYHFPAHSRHLFRMHLSKKTGRHPKYSAAIN